MSNRQIDYERYLQSAEWKQKAYQRMEIDGFKCCMCNSRGTVTNPLQVHHLGYKRIGNEDIYKDLLTLCKSCHRNVHMMMSRTTGYNADGTPRHGWKDDLPDFTTHVFSLSGDNNIDIRT